MYNLIINVENRKWIKFLAMVSQDTTESIVYKSRMIYVDGVPISAGSSSQVILIISFDFTHTHKIIYISCTWTVLQWYNQALKLTNTNECCGCGWSLFLIFRTPLLITHLMIPYGLTVVLLAIQCVCVCVCDVCGLDQNK